MRKGCCCGKGMGVLSMLFAFAAAGVVLFSVLHDGAEKGLWVGFALYFIAKGLFMGPSLMLTASASQGCACRSGKGCCSSEGGKGGCCSTEESAGNSEGGCCSPGAGCHGEAKKEG